MTGTAVSFRYKLLLMATLPDSFLEQHHELSDNEEDTLLEEENADAGNMEEEFDGDLADIEIPNYDDLDTVSKLQKIHRYTDVLQRVEDALQKGSNEWNQGFALEDDPQYRLIVDCNALSMDIENEIVILHNYIRDKYGLKFPELESLIHHPVDYAQIVKKIGNEMDLTLVNLEELLPSAVIMVVSITASTADGKPLPEEVLHKTLDACDRVLSLDSAKKKIIDFVESRMGCIAPNHSAAVGSAVETDGGVAVLAKMPSFDVQLLGAEERNLARFPRATSEGSTTNFRACVKRKHGT